MGSLCVTLREKRDIASDGGLPLALNTAGEVYLRMCACYARGDRQGARQAANHLIDAAARCRAAVSAEMGVG